MILLTHAVSLPVKVYATHAREAQKPPPSLGKMRLLGGSGGYGGSSADSSGLVESAPAAKRWPGTAQDSLSGAPASGDVCQLGGNGMATGMPHSRLGVGAWQAHLLPAEGVQNVSLV